MNRARHIIALALILLFGPAPVMTLLAQADQPQCQMACCKRAGFARSCALHRSAGRESSGFHAAPDCPPGCSQVAGAPSAFAAGFVQSSAGLFLPQIAASIAARPASAVRCILDSFLHQRPPPRFTA
ncbi:MAG: hypothetical protein M3N41_07995 [Acidobacteriota bacterium]|nr:hypothetical protein [Acidobacteriota bacterium]MDP9113671.1 hypothetical protein [Acidobacteriota bacterium]